MAFDKAAYDNQYIRDNYDRVSVLLPKGTAQQVKDYAKGRGLSVSQLIVEALESCYGFDLAKR